MHWRELTTGSWIAILSRWSGARGYVQIVYDPDGENIDLSSRLIDFASPIRHRIDWTFQRMTVQDVGLKLQNGDHYFTPWISGGIFSEAQSKYYYGKEISVGEVMKIKSQIHEIINQLVTKYLKVIRG